MASENNMSGAGKWDNIFGYLTSGFGLVNDLVDSGTKIVTAINSKSTIETDNAVKKQNADTEAAKVQYKHEEEMAKIQNDIQKVKDETRTNEEKISIVKGITDMYTKKLDEHLSKEDVNQEVVDKLNQILLKIAEELLK